MIIKLKYATISQICTKKLKFFDDKHCEKSKAFCRNLGITYLPDRDRKSYYELVNDEFNSRDLIPDEHCKPNDLIFEKLTLEKFKKGNPDNVLFVIDNDKIIGVVHIVDYNHKLIFFEFYKLLFTYEKMLRKFLVLNGENNESFLKFVKQKSEQESSELKQEKEPYWTNRYIFYTGRDTASKLKIEKERSSLGPFQSFNFSDILEFFISKSFFEIKRKYALKELRNRIAHSKDIIRQDKVESAGLLYDFKGLSAFINDACGFFENYETLEEMLRKIKSERKRTCEIANRKFQGEDLESN